MTREEKIHELMMTTSLAKRVVSLRSKGQNKDHLVRFGGVLEDGTVLLEARDPDNYPQTVATVEIPPERLDTDESIETLMDSVNTGLQQARLRANGRARL